MITNRDFGHNLKVEMTKASVSGQDLAKEIDVTVNTISRYRNGTRFPSMKMLKRIVAALGCDSSRFI
jgi:transcriptional regulator with XRE-family HTH domain